MKKIHTAISKQVFLAIDDVEASQLLVTTHYDPLIDNIDDLYGKDSVWFTEKNEDGNTELYPLTDFKGQNKLSSIRKSYKNSQVWPNSGNIYLRRSYGKMLVKELKT